jgi:PPOX class probable F420-dependent enzyme
MSSTSQLSAAQRTFLDGRHYAIVATLNTDGSIQQTVVWYLLEGDLIRFSIGAGSIKAANLRRNPVISITIEDGPRYLTLSGQASVEPTDTELRARLALRYLGAERAEEWLTRRPDAARASVRVTILRVYGQGLT